MQDLICQRSNQQIRWVVRQALFHLATQHDQPLLLGAHSHPLLPYLVDNGISKGSKHHCLPML